MTRIYFILLKMKTNEELFRIFIEEGFSIGDMTVFDKYVSPDFVEHQDCFNPPKAKGAKKAISHQSLS